MPYEHKDNTGALFNNDRRTADNQPTYKGQVKINGQLLDVAAWVKDGTKGQFLSLSFNPPRPQNGAQQPQQQQPQQLRKAGAPQDDFDKFMERQERF